MSTFSELIDFTRSSTGTYLDSVVYGDELVTNGDFSNGTTGWSSASDGVGNVVDGQLVITSSNPSDTAYAMSQSFTVVQGESYKVSANLVSTTGDSIQCRAGSTNTSASYGTLDSNNLFGNVSMIVAPTTNTMWITLYGFGAGDSATFDNISVKKIIGGQGTAGTPLLRTADTNEPRLEYDASGQPLGLLIEEQRTNEMRYSNSLSGSSWSGTNCSITTDSTTSPDSSINASKLTCSVDGGAASTWQYAIATGLNGNYSNSIYLKADTLNYAQLNVGYLTTNFVANFDLVNGTVTHILGTGATITDVGNGWFRCTLPFNTTSQGGFGVTPIDSISSTRRSGAVGSVFVYGAQLESGSFPTSYIPTSGSTVTRTGDVCRIEKEKYHLHQKKGTIYCEFDAITSTDEAVLVYQRIYELATTDSDERVTAWIKNSDGTLTSQLYDNNVSQAGGALEVGYNGKLNTIKLATTYGVNHFQASNDGKVSNVDTSVALDYPRHRLSIMQRTSSGSVLCGHMKRITYTPKVLTEAQLIELTKPSSSPTMSLTFDGQATSELVEGLHD